MAKKSEVNYSEDDIKSLDWKEHIRLRPGMYIGKLGDGSSQDDGIYILLKEIIDNCIDEFVMGYGNMIEITLKDKTVRVRDNGRGIPLGKVVDVVSKINTGAKYDSAAFKKSVGLNGVGSKAVNALSTFFKVQSIRDGVTKIAEFSKGNLVKEYNNQKTDLPNGTLIEFTPDEALFGNYHFIPQHVERMLWNYAYLNTGLAISYNGQLFESKNGLLDLLTENINGETIYPIIHLKGNDIEVAITHSSTQYGEEYYSFVNGQYTPQGGTHQAAFREAFVKVIRDFYKKDYDVVDIRASIISAVAVKVEEPVFESQTKTKLGSKDMGPKGPSVSAFLLDFLKNELDKFLHKNADVADAILKKIIQSERE